MRPPVPGDLTSGSLSKNLWSLAIPMMATNAFQTLFNVVDMIFVGRLGPDAIAAVSAVGIAMMIPFALILGLSIATGAMISRFYGAGDRGLAAHIASQAIQAISIGGLGMTVIGVILAPYILQIFGVTPQVGQMGTTYIQIVFLASIPVSLQFLTAAIFQAVGDAKTALWINIISVVINIALDPVFIFGLGPVPRLEVAGAAWATVLARVIGMITALIFLFSRHSALRLIWKGWYLDGAIIKRILTIGLPSSLQMTLRSISRIILMSIISGYSMVALAAYGIGLRLDMLIMMPGFGLAAATATLVGQNLGAEKPKRAEKSSWLASGYYVLMMSLVGLVFYLYPEPVYRLFNDTPSVIHHGIQYLRTVVLAYPLLAIAIILTRSLAGAGETFKTMIITAISLFGVAVPVAFWLPGAFSIGVRGVWIAIALSNAVNALILIPIFLRGQWKQKAV